MTAQLSIDASPRGESAEAGVKTVSLITVSYNSEGTIRETIESVLAQDFEHIEHIIVDGASTDATMKVVEAYAGRVAKWISRPDDGIYDAMNTGIGLATGDIVGFINSDDFYASNDVVSSVVRAFDIFRPDVVWGDLCYVAKRNPDRIIRYWRSSAFMPGAFSRAWCPPHPTFFVRRSVYTRFGGFSPGYRIAADVELMMRLLETYRLRSHYLPKVLVNMRMGGETNRSLRNIVLQNQEIMHALSEHDLRPSWVSFLAKKSWARLAQFIARPVS
jgi:glycosyltransferase involved in cell wall biosynthesis